MSHKHKPQSVGKLSNKSKSKIRNLLSQFFETRQNLLRAEKTPRTLRLEPLDARVLMAGDLSTSLPSNLEQNHVVDISNPDQFPTPVANWLQAHSGQIDDTLSDNELFDTLARDAIDGIAERAADLVHAADQLPGVGDEIASALAPLVQSALRDELPAANLRSYLESRGFYVESVVTNDQLVNGEVSDLMVLTYHGTSELDPVSVHAEGDIGQNAGMHLHVSGDLGLQAQTEFQITFGVNIDHGVFMQEGSAITTLLTADGRLDGTASIPNLPNVSALLQGANGGHLLSAQASLQINDFDNTPNERFYLSGNGQTLHDVVMNSQTVTLSGEANFQARLSIDRPSSLLPDFLQDHLSNILPNQLSWTAVVDIDLNTNSASYDIDSNALAEVTSVLGQSGNLDDAIFQYLVEEVAAHNPIPASVQTLLMTELPLIGKSLMDILDIPTEMRFLISPTFFRGHHLSEFQPSDNDNHLNFHLDLLSPTNLVNMLKGETFEIFSADIAQRFQQNLARITAIPETTIFSYFGLANVTMQVNLIPDLHFAFNFMMGLDSQGFYVQGNADSTSGQSQIEFGGGITGEIIAEGDVLTVLNLARITASIGLDAFGGFTFVSPHTGDSKLRVADMNDHNIAVTAGIDLNLGLRGEIGLLDLNIKREAHEERTFELYRHSGGTLSDIKDKLSSFSEKYRREARTVIFAGAAAGEPHCMIAATTMLYNELNHQFGPTARALYDNVTHDLGKIAKSLRQNLSAGIVDIAKVIKNDLGASVLDVAKTLKNDLSASLTDVAKVLKNNLSIGVSEIAGVLRALGASLSDVARILGNDLNVGLNTISQTLGSLTTDVGAIASAMYGNVTTNLGNLAESLSAISGAGINGVARGLGAVSRDMGAIATAMRDKVTSNLDSIASAMWAISWSTSSDVARGLGNVSRDAGAIAAALKANVTSNLNSIASAMWTISWTTSSDVARGLGNVSRDAGAIAAALKANVTSNLNSIASAMWTISWTTSSDVARGLGNISRDVGAIAAALKANVTSNLNSIASAMWSISWTTSNDVARGLGNVSRDAGAIAAALKANVTSNLNSIASAMWSISWTSINDVARGLGNVSRDAGAIASALRTNVTGNLTSIADAMYHAISWTSYTDVANGLKSVTSDANRIASALRNGAGATAAQVSSVIRSVGSGLSNLQSAISNGGSAISANANRIGNDIARVVGW